MARSLNRVQLIGNLTRDPELRYTPNGTAVCSFGLATNRTWKTETGEKHEEAEFHNIVAWNKLAELCSQFLVKGRKIYVEGRIATRTWTGQDGVSRNRTEIVISDMILLDSRRLETDTQAQEAAKVEEDKTEEAKDEVPGDKPSSASPQKPKKKSKDKTKERKVENDVASKPSPTGGQDEAVEPSDIPF